MRGTDDFKMVQEELRKSGELSNGAHKQESIRKDQHIKIINWSFQSYPLSLNVDGLLPLK